MSVTERLNQDMKEAMKAKDKLRLSVIRMLKAAFQKESIEQKRPLTAEEEVTILARELKQRKDSLHEFEKANRHDLAEQVTAEIAVVTGYLPEQLSEDAVRTVVAEVIAQVGATSASDFGAVMKAVMPRLKGQAEGGLINRVVKDLLS